MLRFIGRLTVRYSIWILLFWIATAAIITVASPNLDDVTSDDQSAFLPEDSISIQGQIALYTHFPELAESGNLVLVFDATQDNVIDGVNADYIAEISQWLISEDAPAGIQRVDSASLTPQAADLLISPDDRTAAVIVSMAPDLNEDGQIAIIDAVGERFEDAPDTLTPYRTGQVFTSIQYNETISENVSGTAAITVMLVAVILLAIFRSPVSPLIPLSIVTIALLVAQGIVALLAENVMTVSSTATVLLIVVIYGAGTDYCLFLISRFREQMQLGEAKDEAATNTVRRVGESIVNSAATTTTGFMAMAFTQFGLFNTTGPILAIAIVVTLLAGLTLTPSILNLLGERTFWPGSIRQSVDRASSGLFAGIAGFIRRYPVPVVIVMLGASLPLAVYGLNYTDTYDFLADMPEDVEAVEGFRVLEQQTGPGSVQPVFVIVNYDESDDMLAESAALTALMAAVPGVADVRSTSQPLGVEGMAAGVTGIDVQLTVLAEIMQPLDGQPTAEQREMMGNLIADTPAYLDIAADRLPELAESDAYAATLDAIERSTTIPQFEDLQAGFSDLADAAAGSGAHLHIADMPAGVAAFFGGDAVAGLVDGYLNADANVARFEVELDEAPYTAGALDIYDDLTDVLDTTGHDYGLAGATANTFDLREITASDLQLTIVLVLGGIFIILVIMLRSLVAPVYLIGTIALSFATTLGITRIATDVLFDAPDLVFWVPFLIFVFLVALGIDYSIFLFGRIKEEMAKDDDMAEAVVRSVTATGAIIVSAGAIVSGSFVALMTGDIVGLRQIGFAVGSGILIDTIIVRSIFVPALALVIGRVSWWPGAGSKAPVAPEAAGEATPLQGPYVTSGTD